MAFKLYQYGIMADKSEYMFMLFVISYFFFSLMGGKINQYVQKRTLILTGYLIGCFAFILIGHQFLLGTNYLLLIIWGLFLNGVSCVFHNMFATMYVKSELMESAELFGIDKESVGGYFGGLKGSCSLLGYFLGPLISSFLYIKLDFELTWLSLAAFQLFYFFVFLVKTSDKTKPEINVELQYNHKWFSNYFEY